MSSAPRLKPRSTSRGPDESTSTRQPVLGWAIRSRIVAPVQRASTCPPATLTLRSLGVADVDAEGCEVPFAGGGPALGAVVAMAGLAGRELSELTPASVMSRPARSMANHAVADTPATAASQIIAMPTAERSFVNMSPLCHFRDDTPAHRGGPPHGVTCCRGDT